MEEDIFKGLYFLFGSKVKNLMMHLLTVLVNFLLFWELINFLIFCSGISKNFQMFLQSPDFHGFYFFFTAVYI